MTSRELENLARVGRLKHEPGTRREFDGLLRSGRSRLRDAAREDLSIESRFDLAYNAAHALSLAALRHAGYRSENRYVVFQALAHTLAMPAATWRVLAKCHERRNRAEYEGAMALEQHLLEDLLRAANAVLQAVESLPGLD